MPNERFLFTGSEGQQLAAALDANPFADAVAVKPAGVMLQFLEATPPDPAGAAETFAVWSGGERLLLGEARNGLIGSHHRDRRWVCVGRGSGARRRLDAGQIKLADAVDVLEHRGELAGHPFELGLVEFQAGQAGDVNDLCAFEHVG